MAILLLVGCNAGGWKNYDNGAGFSANFPAKPDISTEEIKIRVKGKISDKSESARIRGEYEIPVKESRAQLLLRKESSDAQPTVFTSEDGDKKQILGAIRHPASGNYPNQVIAVTLYTWEFPADVTEEKLDKMIVRRYPAELAVGKRDETSEHKWWVLNAVFRVGQGNDTARFESERGVAIGNKVYLARMVGPVTPAWKEAFFGSLKIKK